MLRCIMTVLVLAFWLALPAIATAQTGEIGHSEARTSERAAQIVEVMAGRMDGQQVFAPVFLKAVPPAAFDGLTKELVGQFGAPLAAENAAPAPDGGATFDLRFARGIGKAYLHLDSSAAHLVDGFRILKVEPIGDTVDKVMADIRALPGQKAVLLSPLSIETPAIASLNPAQPLAIGSAFKLYILSALTREIGEGRRNWADVVRADRRSFPGGTLHEWPAGAPVTLQTLATLMISQSDNSATDALFHILGRDSVAREVRLSGHAQPDAILPIFDTQELFRIKADPALAKRFLAADEVQQAAILAALDETRQTPLADVAAVFGATPLAIDTIEWFASPQDLRAIMARLHTQADPTAAAIMGVNPGIDPAVKARFAYVGYKGGSEPGVLNLTYVLQTTSGKYLFMSLGWNDTAAPVDESKLIALAMRLATLAATQ